MSRPSGIVRIRPQRTPLWREVWDRLVLPVLLASVLTAAVVEVLVRVARG